MLDQLAGQLEALPGDVRAGIAVQVVTRVRELTVRVNQLERDIAVPS